MKYFAHTLPGLDTDAWEPLDEHLHKVAALAGDFASVFAAADWGRLAGLWHDLGKYSARFQQYLRESHRQAESSDAPRRGSVDHSTAGAQLAAQHLPHVGRILAYCIASHHTGLIDMVNVGGGTADLESRIQKQVDPISNAPADLLQAAGPSWPRFDWIKDRRSWAFQLSVFCRMLFSCLVDADFLATEEFMNPDRAAKRTSRPPELSELLDRLNAHLACLNSNDAKRVNVKRREVLASCRYKASERPGLFSLTVPTGGGKTLSSLAFALTHAAQNDLRRVIYAIPFTSIIEQNAKVFRDALKDAGDRVVLEHHSNFERPLAPGNDESGEEYYWDQIAADNWDAPVIVTTNIQLFESLFACKTSRCRKLHRVARSVIVLDEVQTLPVHLLRPTLAMLEELCRNYGCSVVLCSATQPAVQWREGFPIGLRDVREIIDEPQSLYSALKRVQVEHIGHVDDLELAMRLLEHDRVLCVVNTRAHAAALFELIHGQSSQGLFHLSANLCPQHRSDVLRLVCENLHDGQLCRVIATQVVEAGVDIDFPVVYRAMTGIDSIAQAAGRCNREGRLDIGHVFVFDTNVDPRGELRRRRQIGQEIASNADDLLGLDAVEQYFNLLYWTQTDAWDRPHDKTRKPIMRCFALDSQGRLHAQFRESAKGYRLIDSAQQPVLVPYGSEGRKLIEELRSREEPPGRRFVRRAQRYSVNVYQWQIAGMLESGLIGLHHDRFWVLEAPEVYDNELLGLRPGMDKRDATRFVC